MTPQLQSLSEATLRLKEANDNLQRSTLSSDAALERARLTAERAIAANAVQVLFKATRGK